MLRLSVIVVLCAMAMLLLLPAITSAQPTVTYPPVGTTWVYKVTYGAEVTEWTTIYIYVGASILGVAVITSGSIGITSYRRKKRLARERIEAQKAEIIDMIEKALR